MTSTQSNIAARWTRTGDIWNLILDSRVLAVIEPSWSDHHSELFLADGTGEYAHAGTFGRSIAHARICLRFWLMRSAPSSIAS